MVRHVFYLHGFGSSPRSVKARFFADRLEALGVEFHCPDLNAPDFSTLTLSRMIRQVDDHIAALDAGGIAMIGSSLGASVALQVAARGARAREIDRMILLAPALDFGSGRARHLGESGLQRWREERSLPVFHYGEGRMRPVHYALYEDARQYDGLAIQLDIPLLIFQGRRDETVDPVLVETFARTHPRVTLHLLDDDHQLLRSLETIWRESRAFLELPAA